MAGCCEVLKWSERGANPRLNRIKHAVEQYVPSAPKGVKVSNRQTTQRGTTKAEHGKS